MVRGAEGISLRVTTTLLGVVVLRSGLGDGVADQGRAQARPRYGCAYPAAAAGARSSFLSCRSRIR